MLDARHLRITDRSAKVTLTFLDAIFARHPHIPFAVRLWDGSTWAATNTQPAFTIILHHPGALRSMFLPPNDLSLGEAYIYGDFDLKGDIQAALDFGMDALFLDRARWWELAQLGSHLLRLPRIKQPLKGGQGSATLDGQQYSVDRNKQAIRYHYDVSNAFYQLWLDERMVYSCGYFHSAADSIDTAQWQKLDYICRKLRLQPDERLLDIGCGWGGLILYAAEHYGVQAHGITLSEAQAELARERIQQKGLQGRVTVEILDYRELHPGEQYDKIVSVGMFEHVGRRLLKEYFQQAFDLLKPGGVFLNHGIGADAQIQFKEAGFTQQYIFPDGDAVPIHFVLEVAEAVGFDVRDVENLREHYALTLTRWRERLLQNRQQALKEVDLVTYRTWDIFLAIACWLFDRSARHLYQTLLYKENGCITRLPLTRADWYDC